MDKESTPNYPLTKSDLTEALSNHWHTQPFFKPQIIFDIDNLPTTMQVFPSFMISSTTESYKHTGHWVLCATFNPVDKSIFFCSLGHDATYYDERLANLMENTSRKGYVYNENKYQPVHAVSCGHFVCYVADLLARGEAYTNILNTLSTENLEANDRLVRGYYYNHIVSEN